MLKCGLSNRMSTTLALLTRFHEDGFCVGLPVLTPDELPEMQEAYSRFYARALSEARWKDWRFESHVFLPWLDHLLLGTPEPRATGETSVPHSNSRLAHYARALLKTDSVVVWSTDWCVKSPSSGSFFSWHQDSTYSKFSQDEAVTLWLAFSDVVSTEDGPVLMKRCSHQFGQIRHEESSGDSNVLALGQTIVGVEDAERKCNGGDHTPSDVLSNSCAAALNALETVPAFLRAGEASAHGFYVVHSSQPNRRPSDWVCERHPNISRRVGLAVRLVRADCGLDAETRQPRRRDRVSLLCGSASDVQGFELRDFRPTEEFGISEMDEWSTTMKLAREAYFQGREGCDFR
jgi:hypothetical protein